MSSKTKIKTTTYKLTKMRPFEEVSNLKTQQFNSKVILDLKRLPTIEQFPKKNCPRGKMVNLADIGLLSYFLSYLLSYF